MTAPIDILSNPVIPMLDAAWIRDNTFARESLETVRALRDWQAKREAIVQAESAAEAAYERLKASIAVVAAKRQEDENDGTR